ncbi:DNA double-strand break repair Rad50 ATPase [Listeria monocytogenes]|uniref:DNA double-strand break repair Rad50 ATPase n=1 Tax=Listeria monocytogenes TaxID=1639 RepID=UPI0010B4F94F|nr:DNA double-strand break repair Rad50 ATPase [Listeria monocytogenes]EAC4706088.1 DNA double-strand break repair Rad50 ATPase [Listeria monocytogenes]EAE0068621.1 DNA double-strand break repair Rad50 ATPase [Listeria monocytogenes]EAE5862139.1 DNA double-strand break repair Rad50 ATPase [Listeria monocytogenes]EAF6250328.1 DNA double-strand break repair Rad50 ATPase [Listeria monocytogenes]EAH4225579.1 DNA double-strand break repair Rad50 ATPase [Listeria monocytogenes]
MDAKSQQAEAQLQLLKKEQSAAEDFLQDLQRQQNEEEWLAEDVARVHQEERESLELLREVWQGAESRSFGYYLADLQEEEKQKWRKKIQANEEECQQKITACRKSIYQLENQQQGLRKELSQ